MHIGFYCGGWPINAFPSGIVAYVHNMRNELLKQGHRVSVFASTISTSNTDAGIYAVRPTLAYLIGKSFRGFSRPPFFSVFGWGGSIGATIRDFHKHDPLDVMEMEESFGWCADVQKLVRIPIVVRLHGPEFLTRISALAEDKIARSRAEMEGKALRRMTAIVSPSKSTLADTLSHYDLHPAITRVIPNPVIIEPRLRLWDLESCDRKTILFVGQFSKVKGGDTVLIAFRKLLEKDGTLKLIFVGPDIGVAAEGGRTLHFNEFRDSLFTQAQRSNITYLGQLPRADIFDLRRKAMLTIVVSRWENQPNAALEAMIQGCPIVANDVGGISEIVEDGVTGLLARRDDIDDLCRKILTLITDPAGARQMGENARAFVADRHAVDKLTENTVDMYRLAISLVKEKRGD